MSRTDFSNQDSSHTPEREELLRLVADHRSMGERLEKVLSKMEGEPNRSGTSTRRQLLKSSAAAVAGLGAASLLQATPAAAAFTPGTVYLYPGPYREVDTRNGLGPQPSNTDYAYTFLVGVGGVYGYIGTVTAVNYSGPGYLVVHGSGSRLSGVSLNYGYFSGGAISSFFACTAYWDTVSNSNRIWVYNYGTSTDIVIDIVGYVYS